MKVGLIHWRVRSWGGAEYLVTKMAEALNLKKVYTLRKPKSPNPFGKVEFVEVNLPVSLKLISKFGRAAEYFVWESFDVRQLGDFDVLITSGATTRAIITPEDVVHINYCHSPARWLYDLYHHRMEKIKLKTPYRLLLSKLREIDAIVDRRVDFYLVNSPIIKRRLWKYLKRDSEVLYPPLDLSKYKNRGEGDFYLHLGRLDREKGVIEVVKAFKKLGKKLILAGGKGNAYSEVMEIMKGCSNIEYLGFVPEEEKLRLLGECRAVVFNAVNEDFGIVPVEANACGKPCIAVKSGFPGIFIKDGVNGVLHDGTVEGIIRAVERFENMKFNSESVRKYAMNFNEPVFRDKLNKYIKNYFEVLELKL